MEITSVYASVLALMFIGLSVRTLRLRRRLRIAVGDGGNQEMLRATRVHGNFAEYVPFTLLLVGMLEMSAAPRVLVHGLCIFLLMGRSIHFAGVSRLAEDFRYRVAGMTLTFAALGGAALGIIWSNFLAR